MSEQPLIGTIKLGQDRHSLAFSEDVTQVLLEFEHSPGQSIKAQIVRVKSDNTRLVSPFGFFTPQEFPKRFDLIMKIVSAFGYGDAELSHMNPYGFAEQAALADHRAAVE